MWWIAQSFAEISVEITIPEHHITGQSIVVELLLLNSGDQPISLPNLSTDRWLVEFEIEHQNNIQKIRSSTPEDLTPQTIELRPRQVKEVRFQIPNSNAWVSGQHNLTVRFPLDKPFVHTQTINVHKQKIHWVDEKALSNDIFLKDEDVLWTLEFNKKFAIFTGFYEPIWIETIPTPTVFTSIHLGEAKHIYWIENNQIQSKYQIGERIEREMSLSIPWTKFEVIGRSITDDIGQLHVPVWVPNQIGTGTLYDVQMNRQQQPSFRKVYVGIKPITCDTALNQANTPVLLLHLEKTLYVLPLTTVGEDRIDRLPPKSTKIPLSENTQHFDFVKFIIDQERGLQILSIIETPNEWTLNTYSLKGKLSVNTIILDKTNTKDTIHTVGWMGSEPIWITRSNLNQYSLHHNQIVTPLSGPNLEHSVRKDFSGFNLSANSGIPTLWYLEDSTIRKWSEK